MIYKNKTEFHTVPTIWVQELIKDFNKMTTMLPSWPAKIIKKSRHSAYTLSCTNLWKILLVLCVHTYQTHGVIARRNVILISLPWEAQLSKCWLMLRSLWREVLTAVSLKFQAFWHVNAVQFGFKDNNFFNFSVMQPKNCCPWRSRHHNTWNQQNYLNKNIPEHLNLETMMMFKCQQPYKQDTVYTNSKL